LRWNINIYRKNTKLTSIILAKNWLLSSGFDIEFVRSGIKDQGKKIYMKYLRVVSKEKGLITLKRKDYRQHLLEKAYYECEELWYSIFIIGEAKSYHLILQDSFLRKYIAGNEIVIIEAQKSLLDYEKMIIKNTNNGIVYNRGYYLEDLNEGSYEDKIEKCGETSIVSARGTQQDHVIDQKYNDLNSDKLENKLLIKSQDLNGKSKEDKIDGMDKSHFSDPIKLLQYLNNNQE